MQGLFCQKSVHSVKSVKHSLDIFVSAISDSLAPHSATDVILNIKEQQMFHERIQFNIPSV